MTPTTIKSKPAGATHPSLGLRELLSDLPGDRRYSVLDLGPASSGNVSFFAGLSCRLYIADLFHTLRQRGGLPPEQSIPFERELSSTLPKGCFDLILCWDILNYLSGSQMEILGRHLASRSRPGSKLFALIAPHGDIPELPQRFEILSQDSLRYTCHSKARRPAPGYREPELNRWVAPFAVHSSYLLRHGVQEYILVHAGGGRRSPGAGAP
jgi:hypothetical protein